MPHFHEALIDDGYYEMSLVMQALADVDSESIAIPDHVPNIGGNLGPNAAPQGGRG